MLKTKRNIAVIALAVSAVTASADNLWIIGDALPYGWNLDQATALLSEPDDATLFSGTVYLTADKDFKFMTYPDWGNKEYGSAVGAVMDDGVISLASGSTDEGYAKLKVTESGNYFIKVDTESLEAMLVKSPYQETEVRLASLFMVGSATADGWDVMKGTPLYQNEENPLLFKSRETQLNEGTFKIATTLKGASSWNGEYWYFRNPDDSGRIALDQDGDIQWDIPEKGVYDVNVDTGKGTIAISKSSSTGVTGIPEDDRMDETSYYTLTGIKVESPQNGIFIKKTGHKVSKIFVR